MRRAGRGRRAGRRDPDAERAPGRPARRAPARWVTSTPCASRLTVTRRPEFSSHIPARHVARAMRLTFVPARYESAAHVVRPPRRSPSEHREPCERPGRDGSTLTQRSRAADRTRMTTTHIMIFPFRSMSSCLERRAAAARDEHAVPWMPAPLHTSPSIHGTAPCRHVHRRASSSARSGNPDATPVHRACRVPVPDPDRDAVRTRRRGDAGNRRGGGRDVIEPTASRRRRGAGTVALRIASQRGGARDKLRGADCIAARQRGKAVTLRTASQRGGARDTLHGADCIAARTRGRAVALRTASRRGGARESLPASVHRAGVRNQDRGLPRFTARQRTALPGSARWA